MNGDTSIEDAEEFIAEGGGEELSRVKQLHALLVSRLVSGVRSLQGSPSELWKAYALKFLDSYSYFSLSIIFTLFLSADFGFSDVHAGTLYGAWGALITIYGLIAGVIVDRIGVSQSLRLGFAITWVARLGLLLTTTRAVLYFLVLFLLPLGNCLGIPVLATGIRRYTTEQARGFAFGLFYVIMNVAALVSGPVVDMLTIGSTGSATTHGDAPAAWSLTAYRAVVLTGLLANTIACGVAWTVQEVKVTSSIVSAVGVSRITQPPKQPPSTILRQVLTAPSFRRFVVVCLLTVNVRMVFRHLDATLPKYMIREFGASVPKGTIYSINPALIIVLVPLVTAATTHMDPLAVIHGGTYISAASVMFLVMSTSIGACVGFVVVLSIGEAIWSPRLYDYTMRVCKEGREGTYMALSSAPLFLAKLPVGFLSGYLLERYCPESGERHSQQMWLIIGLLTASSPILMTLLWRYISHKDDDEDERYTELPVRIREEETSTTLPALD